MNIDSVFSKVTFLLEIGFPQHYFFNVRLPAIKFVRPCISILKLLKQLQIHCLSSTDRASLESITDVYHILQDLLTARNQSTGQAMTAKN